MFILQKGDNTFLRAANCGFKEFFLDKGYKACLEVTGERIYVSGDGRDIKDATSESENILNFKDGDSFFSLPTGVRTYFIRKFAHNFTVDQFKRCFIKEGRGILRELLNEYAFPDSTKQKKAIESMDDKELMRIYKKLSVTDSWGHAGGIDRFVRMVPRQMLPLLMNSELKNVKDIVMERIKAGT
jgi:hypothetical protein